MKVLVTGADGFLGRALVFALQEANYEVVAVARRSAEGYFAVDDINGNTDWRTALSSCEIVVHLAACVHQMHDNNTDRLAEFYRVNTEGTLNLACQARSLGVKRLLFISTVKVNGEERNFPYTEADIPAPVGDYALSKWKAEQGLRDLMEEGGMEIVIIRPPLVYGPEVKGNFQSMVNWVRKGLPLPLGGIYNKRSLIALDNLVDFIKLCVDRERSPLAANEIFLIADGVNVSTPELLRAIACAYGRALWLIPVPERWLKMAAKLLGKTIEMDRLLGSLTVDISKARRLLGWSPRISMSNQLRKMVNDDAFK